MTSTTTHTCDRCKNAKVDEHGWLEQVAVCTRKEYASYNERWRERATADWCPECRDTFDLLSKSEDATTPEPLTLEDLVREIVQEEVNQ